MRKINLKTLLSACLFVAMVCGNATALSAKKNVAYLFTYFTGNAPQEEQICYAISYDGFNYTPLNDGRVCVTRIFLEEKMVISTWS